MKDYIEIVLLLLILDRSLILRKHYKFAIEFNKNSYKYYWAFWIYCKKSQDEMYSRNGGKRLFYFEFKR